MSAATRVPQPAPASAGRLPGTPAEAERREPVYVLELPVRVAHWTIVLSIFVLTVTGWWIGTGTINNTPLGQPAMATVRFIHLVTGWTMLAAMAMRIVWMFTGNEWASWREWVPTTKARLKEAIGVVRFYTFFSKKYPEPPGGHNTMAGMSYCVVYSILAFMFVSGIALEGTFGPGDWRAWVAAPVAWIPGPTLRFLHHAGMWIIWTFMVIHMGIATLIDAETRGNCFSAIISGWRPLCRRPEGEKREK